MPPWMSRASTRWSSSSTSTMSVEAAPSSLRSGARIVSIGGGWGSWRRADCARADLRHDGLQRGDEVAPERHRLVVGLVEGQPSDRPSAGRSVGQPLGEQRRLAEAGRGGDERQLRSRRRGSGVRATSDVRPRHVAAWGRRSLVSSSGPVLSSVVIAVGVRSRVVAATRRTQFLCDGLDGLPDRGRVGVALHEGLDLVADLGIDLRLPEPVE